MNPLLFFVSLFFYLGHGEHNAALDRPLADSTCIGFEDLDDSTNYCQLLEPGDILLEENGILLRIQSVNDRYNFAGVRANSGCNQPPVSIGKYLLLDAAVQIDLSAVNQNSSLVIFNVGHECRQVFYLSTNAGDIQTIPANSLFAAETSLGVHTTYNAGTFIIEGPVQHIFFGGVGVSMDLLCIESLTSDCSLRDLVLEPYECHDSTYLLDIDFYHDFNSLDSFDLIAQDSHLGRFAYDSLPLTLGPLNVQCASPIEYLIRDARDTSCSILGSAGLPCCETCEIRDLQVEVLECLSDSTFSLSLNFHHQGMLSEGFNLYTRGNQLLGSFPYSSLPLVFGRFPISGNDFEYLRVCDRDDPDCCAEIEFPAPDCSGNCAISELRYERSDCENDSFYLFINFEVLHPGSDSFTVRGNGRSEGPFVYDALPLRIGPYPGDCHTPYEFVISDQANADCHAVIELGRICCSDSCTIRELIVERSRCENDSFYVEIDFQVDHPVADGFLVLGNGRRLGPFPYRSLPLRLGPFAGDCETEYEFVIRDVEEESCRAERVLGRVCCGDSCTIRELRYERSRCENDSFFVFVNFDVQAPSSERFFVVGNGRREGPFRYDMLPVRLGPYPGDCETEYEFGIVDSEDEHCRAAFEIGKVCCTEKCEISHLEAEVVGCTSDSTYTVALNFNYQGTNNSGFDIYTRQGFWGYIRSNPPFRLLDFPKSGRDFDLIRVCANDQPDCCTTIEIRSPDCRSTGINDHSEPETNGWTLFMDGNILNVASSSNPQNGCRLIIFDLTGKQAVNKELMPNEEKWGIDMTSFPSGLYVVMINDGDRRIVQKIFKGI